MVKKHTKYLSNAGGEGPTNFWSSSFMVKSLTQEVRYLGSKATLF